MVMERSSDPDNMLRAFLGGNSDVLRVGDIYLNVFLETGSRWTEVDEQPVLITISIFCDLSQPGRTDDISLTVDYAIVAKCVKNSISSKSFPELRDVSCHISDTLASLPAFRDGLDVQVKVVQLKSPLHTKSVSVEHVASFQSDHCWIPSRIIHLIEDLNCHAISGVLMRERNEKQDIVVNIAIETGNDGFDGEGIDFRLIIRTIYEDVSASRFQTIEALTSLVAYKTLTLLPIFSSPPSVVVRVSKPAAIAFAAVAETQLRRSLDDFPAQFKPLSEVKPEKMESVTKAPHEKLPMDENTSDSTHTVAIGLGSNVGDSFCYIERALRLLESPQQFMRGQDNSNAFVHVVDTSFLYETKPMYIENQALFINGACIVETNIIPEVLLQVIKGIEAKLDRYPGTRHGPSTVDLDIVFYGDMIINTRTNLDDFENDLIVPHPGLLEREFLLRPLNDIIPDFLHPVHRKTVEQLFHESPRQPGSPMKKVLPFPRISPTSDGAHDTQCFWKHSWNNLPYAERCTTQIMAIVNITPESFNEDGDHDNVSAAISYISSAVFAGATILDIRGYSKSPAHNVSVEDEANRVVPIIRAVRNRKFLEGMKHDIGTKSEIALQRHIENMLTTPISINTYRWQVAEAAIEAGANCVNDIYAFGGPNYPASPEYMINMKAIVRKHAVPIILAHSRGPTTKNRDYSTFNYAADEKGRGAVVEGIRVELGARVDQITKGRGGIRRWLVMADPGIGFSKTTDDNLDLLRSVHDIIRATVIGHTRIYINPLRGIPLVFGISRKPFVGEIIARQPAGRQTQSKDRSFGTAGVVAYLVQQKATAIRVHDVVGMMDVLKVTDVLCHST